MEYRRNPALYYLAPSLKRPTRKRYYRRRAFIEAETGKPVEVDLDLLNIYYLLFAKNSQEVMQKYKSVLQMPSLISVFSVIFPDLKDDFEVREVLVNGKIKSHYLRTGEDEVLFIPSLSSIVYKTNDVKVALKSVFTALVFQYERVFVISDLDLSLLGFKKVGDGWYMKVKGDNKNLNRILKFVVDRLSR